MAKVNKYPAKDVELDNQSEDGVVYVSVITGFGEQGMILREVGRFDSMDDARDALMCAMPDAKIGFFDDSPNDYGNEQEYFTIDGVICGYIEDVQNEEEEED